MGKEPWFWIGLDWIGHLYDKPCYWPLRGELLVKARLRGLPFTAPRKAHTLCTPQELKRFLVTVTWFPHMLVGLK